MYNSEDLKRNDVYKIILYRNSKIFSDVSSFNLVQ